MVHRSGDGIVLVIGQFMVPRDQLEELDEVIGPSKPAAGSR